MTPYHFKTYFTSSAKKRLLRGRLPGSASLFAPPVLFDGFEMSSGVYPLKAVRGFSLVEMIVSVGIFSIVMLAATSAYLTLIALDRRARAGNDVVNNLSFAIDSMARAIRTGDDYACGIAGGDCFGAGESRFSFTDEQDRVVTYLLSNGAIARCIGSPCNAARRVPLTDSRVTVEALTFYVRGTTPGDNIQPRVIFSARGSLNVKELGTAVPLSFTIETAATERRIDL